MDAQILLFVLALIAGGVVLWLARSEDKEKEGTSHKKQVGSVVSEEIASRDADVQPLSKNEAREWLDNFLVKQQDNQDVRGKM